MQFAKESGIRVDDTQVERTIARIAQDNKLPPEEFSKAVEREGVPFAKYRDDIRNEMVIQRLREREVEGRVTVSDAEVDHFLATHDSQSGGDIEYRIAHILVLVPEQATPDQIETRSEARRGGDASAALGWRFRTGRGGFSGCARRAAGRQSRLAPAGAAADDVRRPGARPQAGPDLGRAALGERGSTS